jgi:glycosyltransferase involved in cell wall biosynthesis
VRTGAVSTDRRGLLMVPAWAGQPTCAQLRREAAAGTRPRCDYVELADALDADVMDMQYLTERATPLARAAARGAGVVPAQIVEAFLRRGRYAHVVARADRLGLPLAWLFKLVRGRRDLVLVSAWLSKPSKAVFLSRLKVHSHLAAIVNYSSVQMEFAAARLGVAPEKLHHALQPVDERFWRPVDGPPGDHVLAVGAEARDYPTLVRALDGLDVPAELAVGTTVLPPSGDLDALLGPMVRDTVGTRSSARIRLRRQLDHLELRRLYAGARLVVVPLRDVDFDAGVTAVVEAMAMGKPVVVTRTRGQVDVVRDGVNGLYVPPGDPVALRAAVRRLLDEPETAARLGRAGRATVEAHHTLDGWVARVAAAVPRLPSAG